MEVTSAYGGLRKLLTASPQTFPTLLANLATEEDKVGASPGWMEVGRKVGIQYC